MRHLLKLLRPRAALFVLTPALLLAGGLAAFAQAPATNRTWAYLLLNDSYLLDDCLLCDRVSIPVPLRGTFDLRVLEQNTLFSRYALETISFTAGTNRAYTVKGGGTFEIGGEFALQLQAFLQVKIDAGFTNKVCYFTNTAATIDRPWPMIDITLAQTNGTPGQVFTLRVAAAPVREIWFSTADFFA